MYSHHNLHLVPGVSRKGSTACPPTPSTQSLMIHHYILVCASLNSSSSLEVQTFPSLVHHSAGPLYLPAATAVDFNVLESTRGEYTAIKGRQCCTVEHSCDHCYNGLI